MRNFKLYSSAIVAILVVTLDLIYTPLGSYPKIQIIPGIVAGGATYIILSAIFWAVRKTQLNKIVAMLTSDATELRDTKIFPESREEPIVIDLNGKEKIELISIPAGSFVMGSPWHENPRSEDEEQHRVNFPQSFWLGKTVVTQAQWEVVMGSHPSHFKGEDRPVENVSWNEAQEFIRRLNELNRRSKKICYPKGYELALPTESQWEYVCRAGLRSVNEFRSLWSVYHVCHKLDMSSKEEDRLQAETHSVGVFSANALGLYDMNSNVQEWCEDLYGPYPKGLAIDPLGTPSGTQRVYRGGHGWDSLEVDRPARRYRNSPDHRSKWLGFRLALRQTTSY